MSHEAKIAAVVFDLDGTLLDTMEYIVHAFERVITEHGGEPDREKIIAAIGPPLVDCYEELLPTHDAKRASDRHHALQQTDEFLELIDEYADVRKVVDGLHEVGVKVAIFTNRRREGVKTCFQKLKLDVEFDAIITPDDIATGKPDPEGLFLIAKLLNISTSVMAMVGDMEVDIETGKRAKVAKTIGITHGFRSREHLREAGADSIVGSLQEVLNVIQKTNQADD